MGAIDVKDITGYNPKEVIDSFGGIEEDDKLSKKTQRIYAWKLAHGETTGDAEALSLISKDLLAREPLATPHTNELYRAIVHNAIDLRKRAKVGREHLEIGKYISSGLTSGIGEHLGIDNKSMRNIIQGMRVNGVYASMSDSRYLPFFWDAFSNYADDYRKMSPSAQRIVIPDNLTSPTEWYRYGMENPRIVGSFAPYEYDYWQKILDEAGEEMLPFSKKVLSYYVDARSTDMAADTGPIQRIREETGVPIDRFTFEDTILLLSSDFPLIRSDFSNIE